MKNSFGRWCKIIERQRAFRSLFFLAFAGVGGGGGERGEFVINARDAGFDIKPDTSLDRRQFYQLTRERNAYLIHTSP